MGIPALAWTRSEVPTTNPSAPGPAAARWWSGRSRHRRLQGGAVVAGGARIGVQAHAPGLALAFASYGPPPGWSARWSVRWRSPRDCRAKAGSAGSWRRGRRRRRQLGVAHRPHRASTVAKVRNASVWPVMTSACRPRVRPRHRHRRTARIFAGRPAGPGRSASAAAIAVALGDRLVEGPRSLVAAAASALASRSSIPVRRGQENHSRRDRVPPGPRPAGRRRSGPSTLAWKSCSLPSARPRSAARPAGRRRCSAGWCWPRRPRRRAR